MNDFGHGNASDATLDDLLGAYAIDATEVDEREAVERYLVTNPAARAEVDDLREAAAMLALLHGEREPAPPHLWESIQASIAPGADSQVREAQAAPAAVVPITAARGAAARNRSVSLRVVSVIAAMAAAISAVVVLAVNNKSSGSPSMSASYSRTARDGREIKLMSSSDKTMMATVALSADGNGYVKNAGLHELPAGQVYQLWVISPGRAEPISAGVLGRNIDVAGFKFAGTIGAVAVSVENAPGAITPTTPIAIGEVA